MAAWMVAQARPADRQSSLAHLVNLIGDERIGNLGPVRGRQPGCGIDRCITLGITIIKSDNRAFENHVCVIHKLTDIDQQIFFVVRK